MSSLVLLLLGLAAVSAAPNSRIVGGTLINISQSPMTAALLYSATNSGHRQRCGGTIISRRAILTAAYCTIGAVPARWRTRVGATNANSGGTVVNTQRIINHPSYNRNTRDHDIAIIRTNANLPNNNNVRAAYIPPPTYYLPDNTPVVATGWGRTAQNSHLSEQLRSVQIWTINQALCRQRYAAIGRVVTDNMICTAVPKTGQRIVGGSTTTISQYPEMVSLLFNNRQDCGGTILNNRAVLTAAHCTHNRMSNASWRSRVGSTNANSGGTVLNTNRIINHPSYNSRTLDNDVAIIRTASNIPIGGNVRAARIAGSNYNLGDNQVVWAAGWGATRYQGPSSEQLRHVQIWTINQNTCRQRYANIRITITNNMLCSGWLDRGGRDQCQGDSGGPLFHNRVVVGVCSFGEGCGDPRFPGVNARVSRYTNWISQNS